MRQLLVFLALFALSPAAQSQLFYPFMRVHASLEEGAKDKFRKWVEERDALVRKNSHFILSPKNLIVTLSNDLETSAYRNGEMVVPYRFQTAAGDIDELRAQGLGYVWWDYHLGMAYFESTFIYEKNRHRSWDVFQESVALRRQFYIANAYADEDRHLRSLMAPKEISGLYGENFIQNESAAVKRVNELKQSILARNRMKEPDYVEAYVFALQSNFAALFADLWVSVLYNDPEKMKSISELTGIPSIVLDAPYRSFTTYPTEEIMPERFTRYLSPIRAHLWQEITANSKGEAQRWRTFENIALRMRIVLDDMLTELDKKLYTNGQFAPIGENFPEMMKSLGWTRERILDQFRMGFCEVNLAATSKD